MHEFKSEFEISMPEQEQIDQRSKFCGRQIIAISDLKERDEY